jgi:hypothetical protein
MVDQRKYPEIHHLYATVKRERRGPGEVKEETEQP